MKEFFDSADPYSGRVRLFTSFSGISTRLVYPLTCTTDGVRFITLDVSLTASDTARTVNREAMSQMSQIGDRDDDLPSCPRPKASSLGLAHAIYGT